MEQPFLWRDASRSPAFFGFIDVKSAFTVVLFVVHMRLWTFALAILGMIFFSVLANFGYDLLMLYRKIRSACRGKTIYSRPWWLIKKRRSV